MPDGEDFVSEGRRKVAEALSPYRARYEAAPLATVSVADLRGVLGALETALHALVVHLGGEAQPEAGAPRDETVDVVDGKPADHMKPEGLPAESGDDEEDDADPSLPSPASRRVPRGL